MSQESLRPAALQWVYCFAGVPWDPGKTQASKQFVVV